MVATTQADAEVHEIGGMRLRAGSRIQITPERDRAFVLDQKIAQPVVATVTAVDSPSLFVLEGKSLPPADSHLLAHTGKGWRYWRYTCDNNPTCLVTVALVHPDEPPMAGDSGRD